MANVTTYLNFQGNTEEAFNFYKNVFGGEFRGEIMRFGDNPIPEGQPPMPKNLKKMVMHISLQILGCHLLQGTDAPKEMGFNLTFGNNQYINLEPDTREETDRLFNALANGGKIEQQLEDMFWGGYFGSVKDKFGVQWMFNFQTK
jgi:PhnB protein